MEQTTITCDICRKRIGVPKLYRAKFRWSRERGRKPMDLCYACEADVLAFLKLAPAEEPRPDAAARTGHDHDAEAPATPGPIHPRRCIA